MTPGTSFSPPAAFGRFRLLHQIGAGVLGPVFRTHDEEGDRLVAVKAFTLDITPERAQELVDQLQRLIDIDLDHPCLARPIFAGLQDSVAYMAQQYVAGESLDAAIRQYGPAPANDALRLIGHVADALDAAERVGVFHGSLHPRDIIVTPGDTHVTGLGVSIALERIGQHGPIRRPYAAPEREAGHEWGAAADVYSLGVIAYEVLTGRRALPGTEQPLPGLAALKVHDGAALRDILEAAIDPDPARRPAKARDFANVFGASLVEGGLAIGAGERAGSGRRKARPSAPKLPGMDEPAEPAVVATPSPSLLPEEVDEAVRPEESAPTAELRSDVEYVPDVEFVPDVEREPVAVDLELYEGVELGTEVQVEQPAAEPAAELTETEEPEPADDLTALKLRPTPQASEFGIAPIIDDGEERPATARSSSPDATWEEDWEDNSTEEELPVPRAIDPTRDQMSPRYTPQYEQPEAGGPQRPWGLIVGGVVVVLLIGLFAGYEIGSRSSRPAVAAPAATAAAPVKPASETNPAVASNTASEAKPSVTVPTATVPPPTPPAAPAPTAKPLVDANLPAAKPAAPAPAAAATGRVVVRTIPAGADVLIDGERAGATPRTLRELSFGAHVVRVVRVGYISQERKVNLTAARPAVRLDITLRKEAAKAGAKAAATDSKPAPAQTGSLSLVTRPPGARVLLDGKDVGVTPLVVTTVMRGVRKVEFKLAGHRPWTTSVTVLAGKQQRVTASLDREPQK